MWNLPYTKHRINFHFSDVSGSAVNKHILNKSNTQSSLLNNKNFKNGFIVKQKQMHDPYIYKIHIKGLLSPNGKNEFFISLGVRRPLTFTTSFLLHNLINLKQNWSGGICFKKMFDDPAFWSIFTARNYGLISWKLGESF